MTSKDGGAQPRERAGGKVVLAVVVALVVLAAGGYAAAYYGAGDKLPRGTEISGVDVGGLSPADAVAELEDGLADRVDRTIQVTVEDRTADVDPAEAGMAIDLEASVDAVGAEESWAPDRLWEYYTGGDDHDAVVEVDDAAMDALIEKLDGGLGQAPVDGQVSLEGGIVEVTDPEPGYGLDPDATRAALVAAYVDGDDVTLERSDLEPDIDADDVREAVDSFANPALAAPVVLRFGSTPVRLAPGDYADALSLEPVDGELEPVVDEQLVERLVDGATAEAGSPVDATVRLVNGKPRVVPGKPGVTFDPAEVSDAFLDVLTKPEGEREIAVEGKVDRPEFTTKDARELGIRRQVSQFTTYFPYAEYRNVNIGRAGELIDGTVLKPGEVFSMNDIVGERTVENGFTTGTIISDGVFRQDLGGGVSQMATTVFNAMFFAGLKDIEHKPHSFYIDRYPVGREATVVWGVVDLRFQNDTEYGVLIDTEVIPSTPSSQGVVTVRMYSTKIWDIEPRTSERYNYTSPGVRTLDVPDCSPNAGYSGFTVDVTRVFRKAGESEIDHTEKFTTVYTPSDTVRCVPPGSAGNGGGDGG